jgi:hypothetical protein
VAPQTPHNNLQGDCLSDTNWAADCYTLFFDSSAPNASVVLDTQSFWNLGLAHLTAFPVFRTHKQYLGLGRSRLSTPPPRPAASSYSSKGLSARVGTLNARVGILNDVEKKVCGTGDKQNGQAESTLKQRDIADSKELDRYEKEKYRIEQELLGAQKVAAQTTNELQRHNYERSRSVQVLVADAAVVDNQSGTWTKRFVNRFKSAFKSAFKVQSKNVSLQPS